MGRGAPCEQESSHAKSLTALCMRRAAVGVATRPLPGGRADLGSLGVSCGSGLLVCLGDRRTQHGLVWQGPSRDAPAM